MTKRGGLRRLSYAATVIVSVILIIAGNSYFLPKVVIWSSPNKNITEKAAVVQVLSTDTEEIQLDAETTMSTDTIYYKAELLSGEYKRKIVSAVQTVDSFSPFSSKPVEPGDRVLLEHEAQGVSDISRGWMFSQYLRTDTLWLLCGVFAVFLLIFGRMKGFNTIVSLGFTCLSIFAVFVPSVLAGANSYVMSSVVCLYTIIMTLVIVNGVDKKTFCAVLGCVCGVALAGILTLSMRSVLGLTGIINEDSIYLTLLETENPIDLLGIIFSAIIIGAMGAIMDVSMSIASSLMELRQKAREISALSLWQSGITIGRDMMGTMANTLVLAYIGSSLASVLLLVVYNPTILSLLNREMVVVEILQALVGSIGILFTIPFTSLVAAFVYTRGGNITRQEDEEAEFYEGYDDF